jgi:DNA polymerase-1
MILIDFMNMAHRCRWAPSSGFGDNNLIYTFLRTFRKTVEDFPGEVFVVFEGRAVRRRELYPDYKGNRRLDTGAASPVQIQEQQDFFRDVNELEEILKLLPVNLVRHPHHECDDVIAHLARSSEKGATVISTDTDFIQLLEPERDIRLWNPVKKAWVPSTPYDYVQWKALVGDSADNIPGVRKGLGDKTAQKILTGTGPEKTLSENELKDYHRNLELIRFESVDETRLITHRGELRERELLLLFRDKGYRSLTHDKTFYRFVETFSPPVGLFA